MEKIYAPAKFECSNHINLKEYFEKFTEKWSAEEQNSLNSHRTVEQAAFHLLGIVDKNVQKSVTRNMGVEELEDHKDDLTSSEVDQSAKKFKTFAALFKFNSKFPKKDYVHMSKEVVKSSVINLEVEKHFVVKIRIYHPFEYGISRRVTKAFYTQKLKFSHEIVLLDSNTLTELRDKILCHSDRGMCVEYDHLTEEISSTNPKDLYPSGFIFIDDVFYNDTRHENSIDYSEVIRDWGQKVSVGPFETATMQDTKISDLKPRFGYPYIYQHQGKCEHLVVFSDAWLLNSQDSLDKNDYPYYSDFQRFYSKTCTICYASQATWVVTCADRLPHRNSFLCGQCFKAYNFIDGKKIGNFKAYPFYDRGRIC